MRTLQPPAEIAYDVFVVIWDSVEDNYVLALPDGRSYELGDAQEALNYFKSTLDMEEMGSRALDCARNFFTAVVLWKEKRCYGAETKESQAPLNKLLKQGKTPCLIV